MGLVLAPGNSLVDGHRLGVGHSIVAGSSRPGVVEETGVGRRRCRRRLVRNVSVDVVMVGVGQVGNILLGVQVDGVEVETVFVEKIVRRSRRQTVRGLQRPGRIGKGVDAAGGGRHAVEELFKLGSVVAAGRDVVLILPGAGVLGSDKRVGGALQGFVNV